MNPQQKICEQLASVEDEKQKVLQKLQQLSSVYKLLDQVSSNLSKMAGLAAPTAPIAPSAIKPKDGHRVLH